MEKALKNLTSVLIDLDIDFSKTNKSIFFKNVQATAIKIDNRSELYFITQEGRDFIEDNLKIKSIKETVINLLNNDN